jgi:hypothetical protein
VCLVGDLQGLDLSSAVPHFLCFQVLHICKLPTHGDKNSGLLPYCPGKTPENGCFLTLSESQPSILASQGHCKETCVHGDCETRDLGKGLSTQELGLPWFLG